VIAFGNTLVMPDLAAIASVDGPNVVRRGEVENAVDFGNIQASVSVSMFVALIWSSGLKRRPE
jgi:hypothetical protein